MFRNFCVGIYRYSALTYDVIKSYPTRGGDKKIRNSYIRSETRVLDSYSLIKKNFQNQGMYLPTILSPDFFLYLAAFECNTTSDWLNLITIRLSQSEVVLHSNLHN